MAKIEVENVDYKTTEIFDATCELVINYAQYSRIEGTQEWPNALVPLGETITSQLPRTHILRSPFVILSFTGFPYPKLEDGERKAKAHPPKLILQEGIFFSLLDFERQQEIEDIHRQIVGDVSNTHGLDVSSEANQLVIEFSKDRFARNIEVSMIDVPLLEDGGTIL